MSDLEIVILHHHTPLGVPSIVPGDFNIDCSKKTLTSKQLSDLIKYYGFHQCIRHPTHRQGGILDHFYHNIISTYMSVDTISTYYSDHLILSMSIPLIIDLQQ